MTELHNPELFSVPQPIESSPLPPLAIVGMGCRFPGGANNPEHFWENLLAKKDCIVDVPKDRWEINRFYDSDRNKPGKMYVRSGGFLQENIYAFDPLFFGISPREAAPMDPQQRLLLEVSWEALEDAGIDPESLAGSETGVFIGGFMLDNKLTQLSSLNRHTITANTAVGMTLTMLSNRLSYFYDLRGPSMTIDTACSASMVSLDQACQSLWNGTTQLALVGGVNIMHRPEIFIALCKGGFLAADGRSKAFDARADGYGRGEGAGVIVVKPLAAAKRDGDRIHALIRATGCNQDGHTDGITVPNPLSQQTLIRRVAQRAQVPLKNIQYFEAHGTGTAVGDPLELSAIGNTIGRERSADAPCIVGSVKSSIGHLEAAAGMASLIKTTLCLKHHCVPPQANLQQLNPKIPFYELNIRIPRQPTPLTQNGRPLHAAVNSFGYGGTNACAVLESYTAPIKPLPHGAIGPAKGQRFLLPLSARSKSALNAVVDNFIDFLDSDLLAGKKCPAIEDLCYSAGSRRAQLSQRLCVSGNGIEEIRTNLQLYRQGKPSDAIVEGQVNQPRNKLAFVFTGMGPQWWGMGRELFYSEPVFHAAVVHCDQVFKTISGWSIIDEMLKPENESRITETQVAQPANFVIQAALVKLLESWDIRPSAMVGHSVGEVASAYISGILSLEQALTVSFHRSRIQKKAANQGCMLAAAIDEATATTLIAPFSGKVSIAAINGPSAITLAGDSEGLQAIAAHLQTQGVFNRMLQVEVAYHSPTMDPLLDEIRECLGLLNPASPSLPVYSTVTGELIEDTAFDGEYWCRNVRQPVYFCKALNQMLADGYEDFIEIGPHPVLSTSIRECFSQRQTTGSLLGTLKRGTNEQITLKQAVATLHTLGYRLNWAALSSSRFKRDEHGESCSAVNPDYISLPTYPWQREHHWNEAPQAQRDRTEQSPKHAVLGCREDGPATSWLCQINSHRLPYIDDHKVEGLVILPGATYIEAALCAHQEMTGSDACLLSNLRLHNALVIESDNERQMQTRVHDDGSFAIHSHVPNLCDEHTLHTTGKIQPLHLVNHRNIDLDALKISGMQTLQAAEIYAELASRGLQYGPRFQGIQQLWRRDAEILARIEAHVEIVLPANDCQLHPTLLDACFQSLISALPKDSNLSRQVYIPISIEQLRHYRKPADKLYCHGILHDMDAHIIRGDIRLCDDQGEILVEILNLRCQALRSLHRSGEDMLDTWAYQGQWLAQTLPPAADAIAPTHQVMLLINRDEAGRQLQRAFEQHSGSAVIAVTINDSFTKISEREYSLDPTDPEQIQRLFEVTVFPRDATSASLVYGLAMTAQGDDPAHVKATSHALSFLQAVQPLADCLALRVCLLSRDAQRVLPVDSAGGFAASPLIGLARVAAVELPALNCSCIDIDQALSSDALNQLAMECSGNSKESEIALRADQRFVYRLRRSPLQSVPRPALALVNDGGNFELAPKALASDSGSAFQMCCRREPGAGEMEIEIEAAVIGANAFDLQEISGRITRIGSGIRYWRPDDEIFACYRGALTRFATLSADAVLAMHKPSPWPPSQSAGALSGLALARTALLDHGQANAEKSVLILGSDTATGQSLSQLAHSLECHCVVVAAKSCTAPNGLYLNSATLMEDLVALQPSGGFDIIATTAAPPPQLDINVLLAERGQYIVLNAQDDCTVAPVHLASGKSQLQLNKSVVMAKALEAPETTRTQLQPLLTKLESTGVQLTLRSSDNILIDDQAPGIASFDSAACLPMIGRPDAALRIRADVTYLITGGFGGFGLAMARWLVAQGARHLVLVSRNGAQNDEAIAAFEELLSHGAMVHARATDIADGDAVQRLLEKISAEMPPLAGIFHTAGLIDDRELLSMNAASMAKVMAPKALGAWHLHRLTQHLALDCFVLYSSVSALIGNRNQANYVAANVFLDNLAHHRNACGLPATSINWGALNDVGMAADANVIRHLEHIGITSFSVQQAQEAFARLMRSPVAQTGIFDVDWQRWSQFENSSALPRYEELVESGDADSQDDSWAALHAQGGTALIDAVITHFSTVLAATLKLAVEHIDPQTPIHRYGLDSLMAIDLQMKIRETFKVDISILELMKGNSTTRIAEVIATKLTSLIGASTHDFNETSSRQSTSSVAEAPVLEDIARWLKDIDRHESVDAMTEEELDARLRQELELN